MKNTDPKGTLIPIGGGEDRNESKDVLGRIISETGKTDPNICLITLATGLPKKAAETYEKAFKDLNISKISAIYYTKHKGADTEENIKKIENCDLIMFSGGKQLRITRLMKDTQILALIKQRYMAERNFVVAGTSAGAAAMSNIMIVKGKSSEALLKGSLELTDGLGLIDTVILDTHFVQRGRIGRLIKSVTFNPEVLGLGLGEDTSVIIKDGIMEVCGSGLVIIVDGTEIEFTDVAEIHDGKPITVEGLKLNVLANGKKFDISKRKLLLNYDNLTNKY